MLPGTRLTNYVFAHSKYPSPLGQRDVLTDLIVDLDEQPASPDANTLDESARARHHAPWLIPCALAGALLAAAAADGVGRRRPAGLAREDEQALATRNYDGTFLHVSDGRVETMRIVHRVRGGHVTERLLSLDGSGREFVRNNDELTCYLPDKRTILVEARQPSGPFLGSLPQFGNGVDSSTASSRCRTPASSAGRCT